MKIAFMGTPEFAVPTLQRLIHSRHQVIVVVAQPSRPAGRGRKVVDPATVRLAHRHGIPVLQPRAMRRGPFPQAWSELGADLGVVVAFGRILTPRLLAAPRLGCVNVHASLLPAYRGAAPIQWAIIRGEKKTGVTTMLMDEGLDTGPILMQRELPIHPDETAEDLSLRLSDSGAHLLMETIENLHDIQPRPQDHSRHSLAPPLRKDQGRVNWLRPAREISCLVRGLYPWPGAWATLHQERIRIHRASPVPWRETDVDIEPGQVLETRKRLLVATGEGALDLRFVQRPSRKAQTGIQLACGIRIRKGEVFQ